MPTSLNTPNKSFYSKVMLFGEYSIICGSMALTIPYRHFKGSLKFLNKDQSTDIDFAQSSNQKLRDYYQKYLLPTGNRGGLPIKFNYKSLEQDISDGLYFESSIPEGYGLGSSGALVAALYHRFIEDEKTSSHPITPQLNIPKVKKDLAVLESWFHGTSSGIDPLICYIGQPLLIKEDKTILPVNLPHYNLHPDDAVFLINSGSSVKTAPLVDQFIKDCENPSFKQRMLSEYIPLNNSCIEALIDADIEKFTKNVQALSAFQAKYFYRMIPSTIKDDWEYGISSGKFTLKLCGSGGGGFMLGFTHHYKEVSERFKEKGVEIIPVYKD